MIKRNIALLILCCSTAIFSGCAIKDVVEDCQDTFRTIQGLGNNVTDVKKECEDLLRRGRRGLNSLERPLNSVDPEVVEAGLNYYEAMNNEPNSSCGGGTCTVRDACTACAGVLSECCKVGVCPQEEFDQRCN